MAKRFEAASLWLAWLTGLPHRSAWRRLAFQRALRETALDFAGLTLDSFELVMNESIRRLGEAGGFKLVYIRRQGLSAGQEFRWSSSRAEAPAFKQGLDSASSLWLDRRLASGENPLIMDLARLPTEAAEEKKALVDSGAGSLVVIQLACGDLKLGRLSMFSRQSRLDLAPFDQRLLRMCGELFSRVLFRLQNEERARASAGSAQIS